MEMKATVSIDLSRLERFAGYVRDGLEEHTGPIGDAFENWGRIFRAFLQERFYLQARGGGEWPPLKIKSAAARAYAMYRRFKAQWEPKLRRKEITQEEYDKRYAAVRRKVRKQTARTREIEGANVSILIDTGTLAGALEGRFAGAPGALEEKIPFGIRVGYGGPAPHPKSKGATVAEIALFHQEGGPRLPQRRIIVDPDEETISEMGRVMTDAVYKLIRTLNVGEA